MYFLWILVLFMVKVCNGAPTPAPTYDPSSPTLVTFDVAQTIGNVDTGNVNDYVKNVVVGAVKDSLVCCELYSVEITSVAAGVPLASRRKLMGDDMPNLRARALGTVPTTIFNYTISFLYPELKYDSAYNAFTFITTELVKNIETGGFVTHIRENAAAAECLNDNCAAVADVRMGSYWISANTYPLPPGAGGGGGGSNDDAPPFDDGVGLAIGMTFTMFFTLIGFFYAQYCWGYLPCYDKLIKRKWKQYTKNSEFYAWLTRDSDNIDDDDDDDDDDEDNAEEEEEEEKAIEAFLSSIQVRDEGDITCLADPDVRFGRGHHERRKSAVHVIPLSLLGAFSTPGGGPPPTNLHSQQKKGLGSIFGEIDGVTSPLHDIGEGDEEEEEEDGEEKAAKAENARLGIDASSMEDFFANMPDKFTRNSTFDRLEMSRQEAEHAEAEALEAEKEEQAAATKKSPSAVEGTAASTGSFPNVSTPTSRIKTSRRDSSRPPIQRSEEEQNDAFMVSSLSDMADPSSVIAGNNKGGDDVNGSPSNSSTGNTTSSGRTSTSSTDKSGPVDMVKPTDAAKSDGAPASAASTGGIAPLGLSPLAGGLPRKPSLTSSIKRVSQHPTDSRIVSLGSSSVSKFPSRRRSSFKGLKGRSSTTNAMSPASLDLGEEGLGTVIENGSGSRRPPIDSTGGGIRSNTIPTPKE
jgi:hypothetical protein